MTGLVQLCWLSIGLALILVRDVSIAAHRPPTQMLIGEQRKTAVEALYAAGSATDRLIAAQRRLTTGKTTNGEAGTFVAPAAEDLSDSQGKWRCRRSTASCVCRDRVLVRYQCRCLACGSP